MSNLTIERVYSGKHVEHFRVSRGVKGGEAVTVRVGIDGVYACLFCRSVECSHALAVRDFDTTKVA